MLVTCWAVRVVVDGTRWAHGAGSPSDSLESVSKGSRRGGRGVYVGLSSNRLRASSARLWATIADQT